MEKEGKHYITERERERDRQTLHSISGVSELVKKLLISNNKAERQRERERKDTIKL